MPLGPGTKTVAIIPARYGSQRFPGKPLLKETGKYLIQHVYENVRRCPRLERVIVATDDPRILEAVTSFGGEAMMTSPHHPNGTCRVAEVAERISCDRVLNIQGDEPELGPEMIDTLAELLDEAEMATLATSLLRQGEWGLPNRVKVVLDQKGWALYFSRAPIPYGDGLSAFLHLGLYGFRKDFLMKFVGLPETPLERIEKLEQLRALEHGFRIKVGVVRWDAFGGIDTPEDYEHFVARWRGTLK